MKLLQKALLFTTLLSSGCGAPQTVKLTPQQSQCIEDIQAMQDYVRQYLETKGINERDINSDGRGLLNMRSDEIISNTDMEPTTCTAIRAGIYRIQQETERRLSNR